MTAERFLLSLSVLAVGLLLAAIGISGGKGPSATGLALPVLSLPVDFFSAPSLWKLADGAGPVAGFVAGWVLRWVYGLPWAAIPRAVVAWLLGWRSSAIMLAVAVGCTAVLLLY